jgi:hypothetical protein
MQQKKGTEPISQEGNGKLALSPFSVFGGGERGAAV